ncbi:MAG: lysophospholipase [Longimicrobiales bacterium]
MTLWRNRYRVADASRRPLGRVSARDGVELAVTQNRSSASDPTGTVLIVHGWGEHQGRYKELSDRLVGLGFSVWSYDLRGHGASGGPKGHTPQFSTLADDLTLVTEHARAIDGPQLPWFLLGHSLGGLIVLRALQTRRCNPAAACLSAPWLRTARHIPAWKRGMARVLNRVAPSWPVPNRLDPTVLTKDPVKIAEHQADPLIHGMMTSRMFFEVERAQEEALGAPGPLGCPVLVLIPGDDPVVDAATTAHFVHRPPGGEVRALELPESRHEPFNEVDREDRFDEVGSFFNGVLE